MKLIKQIVFFSVFLLLNSCIAQFLPKTEDDQEMLVVDGLITDQPGNNTIKLSKSLALGNKDEEKPLMGCSVSITEDDGISYSLAETAPGTYITDSTKFRGKIGSRYILHINANNNFTTNNTFESIPMEMKPVPPIDSIYYEKKTIRQNETGPLSEGCQVFLNTHDPTNMCQFYRWDYSETWEFWLPYSVAKRHCWISNNSIAINIKNASVLAEDRIDGYPINFVSDQTDRLSVKYSMLVNQYSMTEDEYLYWEKLQNISEEVGSLYDITPAPISSNITCIEDPNVPVLGYFSVSAKSSKRVFIKDNFLSLLDLYSDCPYETIFNGAEIPGLDVFVWIIDANPYAVPPYQTTTKKHGCADCSVRGTPIKPVFW